MRSLYVDFRPRLMLQWIIFNWVERRWGHWICIIIDVRCPFRAEKEIIVISTVRKATGISKSIRFPMRIRSLEVVQTIQRTSELKRHKNHTLCHVLSWKRSWIISNFYLCSIHVSKYCKRFIFSVTQFIFCTRRTILNKNRFQTHTKNGTVWLPSVMH